MISLKHRIINWLSLFILLASMTMITYAWISNVYQYDQGIIGKAAASYFSGGTGTSEDPYIIAEPKDMYDFAALNNLGLFDTQTYYFKLADKDTGDPTVIDFGAAGVPTLYQSIEPVGDNDYPFKGIFIGNDSTLKSLTIDGDGKQDIGLFGYVESGASITNFFIDGFTILSNPSTLDDKTDFHTHNDGLFNRATGYLVGHLGFGAILENVFVIGPTIQSLSNADANRTQYGMIGYNESDAGTIVGGPRGLYEFTLEAYSFWNQVNNALNAYYDYYINGSSTLKLTDAFSYTLLGGVYTFIGINSGYSFSNLKISATPGDTDPIYLYDMMKNDGYSIIYNDMQYSRENLDLIGPISFINVNTSLQTADISVLDGLTGVVTPALGTTFNPTNYPKAFILYVRVDDPTNLGQIAAYFQQGKEFAYYAGFDSSGNYMPNYSFNNKTKTIPIGTSGVLSNIAINNAFCAVSVNESTGDLTVVDPNVDDYDYFIYMLGLYNGNITIDEIDLVFPPAELTEESLTAVSKVDFVSAVTDVLDANAGKTYANYTFSYLNFGYSLTEYQKIQVEIQRASNGAFSIYITYDITDTSLFYFDIINTQLSSLTVYVNSTSVYEYTGSNKIIEIELNYDDTVSVNAYN
ncbi:MAG: hypothetical protein JXB20_03880 [Bacilli bacterium]|nr:hypothetical protein [Bacilli bacterium]MBN2696308.1 hypothetical protein [Bacilli bacterium]